MNPFRDVLMAALALGAAGGVHAQATIKPDGQWRAVLGLGGSASSGNASASNLSLAGDGVRATEQLKSTVYGTLQLARKGDLTTAEAARLGGRQDWNLNPRSFAYGSLDLERNRFANLSLRSQLSGGLGWHLLKLPTRTWDVFGGVSYTNDQYVDPMLLRGVLRDSYGYAGLLLGEESTHKLTATTSAKQRLVVVPNLKNSGEYRANWDAGLAVSMSNALSLSVGLSVSYNSDPGVSFKTTDALLTTGVSMKFE